MKKERIDSINLIRAIAAVAVFMYHAYWNIGCRYGELDVWIEQSFVWMTLFFVLSGVVLRYNYGETKFDSAESLWKYFGKRALSIVPIYFLIHFVYLFFDSNTSLFTDVITLPFQITLTQEFGHYLYLVNGGAWFFSSIFICYLLFPYLNMIASSMTKGQAIAGTVILLILFGFTPFIGITYGVDIYNNSWVRVFEFALGVCLVKIIEECPKVTEKFKSNKVLEKMWLPILVLFLAGIYGLQKIEAVDAYPAYFNMYTGVAGMVLLYVFIVSKDKILLAISNSKVIKFLSGYSLEIWCATFFTTSLAPLYQKMLGEADFNLWNIILSAIINLVIAFLLKLYTKLVKKLVDKFTGKKVFLVVPGLFVLYFVVRVSGMFYLFDEYNFTNDNISSKNMTGVYHDEGDYAWISGDFSVRFSESDASKICFKADTSVESIGDVVNCAVYVDGTFVENVVITQTTQEFVVEVPEGVIKNRKFTVQLMSDKIFVPGPTDPRELAARLFYIRCE